jgi:hypothetical protein
VGVAGVGQGLAGPAAKPLVQPAADFGGFGVDAVDPVPAPVEVGLEGPRNLPHGMPLPGLERRRLHGHEVGAVAVEHRIACQSLCAPLLNSGIRSIGDSHIVQ